MDDPLVHSSSLVSTKLAPERAGASPPASPTSSASILSDLEIHGSSLKATQLTPPPLGAPVPASKGGQVSDFASRVKPGSKNAPPLLYVSPVCPHAHKAWLAVLETNVPCDVRFEDLGKKSANLQDAFAAGTYEHEPLTAKVPVLQHDGNTFVESVFVATYVVETFSDANNVAYASPAERYAGALFATQFNQLTPLYTGALRAKSHEEVDIALDKVRAQLRQCERALRTAQTICAGGSGADGAASAGPFACNSRYTLAEITTSTMIPRLALVLGSYRGFRFHKELEQMQLTQLAKWVDACSDRPSFKKTQEIASDVTGKDFGSAIIDMSAKFVTFRG